MKMSMLLSILFFICVDVIASNVAIQYVDPNGNLDIPALIVYLDSKTVINEPNSMDFEIANSKLPVPEAPLMQEKSNERE